MKKFKVILLGDGGVGKSAIRKKCGEDKDSGDKHRFKKGLSRKVVEIGDGQSVMLEVHDTGGMERYATIPRHYYAGVHGTIVLYDMTQEETLENAPWWHREGTRNGTDNAVYMLMGNKVDALKDDDVEAEKKKGKDKAAEFGALYAAVSAKTGEHIDDAFLQLAQAMADNASDDVDVKESKDDLKIRRKEKRSGGFCVLL